MRPRNEVGSAAVLGVQLVAVLVLVAMACAAAVAYVLAHRQAQAAADLAALAGAAAVQQGAEACPAAADIAGRNDARLRGCTVVGATVAVEVASATGPILGRVRLASASARAGPVEEPGAQIGR